MTQKASSEKHVWILTEHGKMPVNSLYSENGVLHAALQSGKEDYGPGFVFDNASQYSESVRVHSAVEERADTALLLTETLEIEQIPPHLSCIFLQGSWRL